MGKLKSLVKEFRYAIEKAINEESEKNVYLEGFPCGRCGVVSDLLAQYLKENGYDAQTEWGIRWIDGYHQEFSHRWVRVGSLIIDITADQFNSKKGFDCYLPSVYIAEKSEFHDSFIEKHITSISGFDVYHDLWFHDFKIFITFKVWIHFNNKQVNDIIYL